jgi:translation initiation factor IF-3
VDARVEPPVCKILDRGRQRYLDQKNARAARASEAPEAKEVQIRPGIDAHDLEIKIAHVGRFLAAGARTKIVVRFRGRELRRPERGRAALERMLSELVDSRAKAGEVVMEGRNLSVTLTPCPKA